jgi:prophage tail gpP-like protein
MPDAPVVTLKVSGVELTSFDGLTIDRNFDNLVDSFAFSIQSTAEIRARIRPAGYESCEVWISGQKVLTGQIEKPAPTMADASLSIEGRSLAGPMVDCNIKGAVQFGNQTLASVARTIATPFGVTVSLPQGDSAKLGAQVVAGDGETAGGFLQKIALDMGWLWRSDASGFLALHRPAAKGSPVARLVEGKGSFKDCRLIVDGTGLFSEYEVRAQVGTFEAIKDTVTDSKIRPYRPKIITGTDGSFRDIKAKAKMARSLAVSAAVSIEVDVGDWTTDDGVLWEPGQFVEVTAPTCYLDSPTLLQIAGVPLTLAGDGRRATLRLVLPGTYTGEAVLPW